jgi:hypothetical protein
MEAQSKGDTKRWTTPTMEQCGEVSTNGGLQEVWGRKTNPTPSLSREMMVIYDFYSLPEH